MHCGKGGERSFNPGREPLTGSLTLVEGPAGSGKSQIVREMLAAGEIDIVSDYTEIWSALRGIERDPETGRYPIRENDDPAVASGLVSYTQSVVVRQALANGLRVVVTSGTPRMALKWSGIATGAGAPFEVRTVDPGIVTVVLRLLEFSEGREARAELWESALDPSCYAAVQRWYEEIPPLLNETINQAVQEALADAA